MNKLLITRGADFASTNEWIRFDIRNDDINKCIWAAIEVKKSSEMIPNESFEVCNKRLTENLCAVIGLLKEYLDSVQRNE